MRRLSRIAALGPRLLGTVQRLRFASALEHRRHAQILLAWADRLRSYPRPPQSPPPPCMPIVTDPLFYLLAIPAVTLLGLGKGGFAGVGMISTPLLALVLPPLQAAAILLP